MAFTDLLKKQCSDKTNEALLLELWQKGREKIMSNGIEGAARLHKAIFSDTLEKRIKE